MSMLLPLASSVPPSCGVVSFTTSVKEALAVMVNVSPDTAVVIPVPPAILNVSLPSTAVPVESSPTKVIDPPPPVSLAFVHLAPSYFKTCPTCGFVYVTSPELLSVVILRLYNNTPSTLGSLPLESSCTI